MAKSLFIRSNYLQKFFKLSNSSKNFKHINHVIYDFHDQLLRPYWTYFVNKNDYNFHLINSASGFYGFKNKNNKYPIDTMYHHLCNWKNYYVDREIFYEHIKKIIPSTILLKKKFLHSMSQKNTNMIIIR